MIENKFWKPKFCLGINPFLLSPKKTCSYREKYVLPLNLMWGHLRFVSYMELKNDFGVSKHKYTMYK